MLNFSDFQKTEVMSGIRKAVQQYGAIVETLVHAFLSFAPVTAGTGDVEAETTIQLIQSMSDLVALRRDRYLSGAATGLDVRLLPILTL